MLEINKICDDLWEVIDCKGTTYVHAADKFEAARKYREMSDEESNWK